MKTRRGGSNTLVSLGKAVTSLMAPAILYLGLKRQQRGRDTKRIIRTRRRY